MEFVRKGRQKDGSTRELGLCGGRKKGVVSNTERCGQMHAGHGWLSASFGVSCALCYADTGLV